MNDLPNLLRLALQAAPAGDKVVTIHLFGIDHAEMLDGVNLQQFAEQAGIGKSFGTELRKGVRLAKFVRRK